MFCTFIIINYYYYYYLTKSAKVIRRKCVVDVLASLDDVIAIIFLRIFSPYGLTLATLSS